VERLCSETIKPLKIPGPLGRPSSNLGPGIEPTALLHLRPPTLLYTLF
jgi:hypothetical protein